MKTDQELRRREDRITNAVMAGVCAVYVAAVIFAVWVLG